jgi:hypothetical protein
LQNQKASLNGLLKHSPLLQWHEKLAAFGDFATPWLLPPHEISIASALLTTDAGLLPKKPRDTPAFKKEAARKLFLSTAQRGMVGVKLPGHKHETTKNQLLVIKPGMAEVRACFLSAHASVNCPYHPMKRPFQSWPTSSRVIAFTNEL